MENVPIHMMRPHLENLPQFDLPKPYEIRTYQPGDEQAWRRIHIEADLYNTFTGETFQKQFGTDQHLLSKNQFYLISASQQPIGTTSAWAFPVDKEDRCEGLVHWVALLPDEQGKGLSKPLLSAVCHRLKARGFSRACLTTSSSRTAAIGLYLSFGFQPDLRKASHRDVWRDLRSQLGKRGQLIPDH